MSAALLLTMALSTGQFNGGYYYSNGDYWSQPYYSGYNSGWYPGYSGWSPWSSGRYYTNYSYPAYSYPSYSYPSYGYSAYSSPTYGYSSYSNPTYSYPTATYGTASSACDVSTAQSSSGTYEERTAARPDLGAQHLVRMTDKGAFEPAQIKIQVGETVMWRNDSGKTHSVTADPAKAADPAHVSLPSGAEKFDSGDLAPGQTFSQSFSKAGIYHYICRPHEHKGMVGTIVVTDSSGQAIGHSADEAPAPAPANSGSRRY